MTYSKEARTGVVLYRLFALAALVLSVVLFITGGQNTTTRIIVFVAWMALCLFTCIRILGDIMSGQQLKTQRFENTIKAFEENSGGRAAGVRTFYLTVVLGGVLKLAVPVVLWWIFR